MELLMIQLLAVVHRQHRHHHCYHPHLMEQQQNPQPLLQSQQPDINITSVDKKLVTSAR